MAPNAMSHREVVGPCASEGEGERGERVCCCGCLRRQWYRHLSPATSSPPLTMLGSSSQCVLLVSGSDRNAQYRPTEGHLLCSGMR